jgi:hypothetical protein
MKLSVTLRRAGLLALLPAAAVAQDVPRTYPPAAPSALDSATNAPQMRDKKQFANQSVLGMGPSKGLIVRYERLPFDFKMRSTGLGSVPSYETLVKKNANLSVKLYAPLLNHPHLKLILGLNYDRQEFQFEEQSAIDQYSLYQNIENKGLSIIGTQLAIIRPVDDVHWYLLRTKGELNGDYNSDELSVKDYLKVTSEFIYGWKRSPTFSWGLGLQLGYSLGRQSLYPVLVYNRTFNERWGIEALAPARVLLRRNLSPRALLFGGYELASSNYNLKLRAPFATENNPKVTSLELRQIDVKFRLRLEHELLPFLWTGIETGYRYNYQLNAFDRTNSARDRIINSQYDGSLYFSLDLFLVPPRHLLERAGVRR